MRTRYIINLRDARRPHNIGNKAQLLRFLFKRGYQVPATHVCTWDAFVHHLKNREETAAAVTAELTEKIDGSLIYAIRSSANIEDSQDCSFAGQFKSILNVHGIENILKAIETIWESTNASGVASYMKKTGIAQNSLKMAAIIQEMVPAVFSGVSFSRNPLTGMDEIVVEAVRGNSEALLQEGVTPARWIHKWGEWISLPEREDIPRAIIQEVVRQTREIAKVFGKPVDLEWAFDGSTIYWVQLREITSLRNINVYSNYIAKEVLPGIIKPLVWSINVPMVNSAWKEILSELVGELDIDANELAKSFYYHAYFNMGVIGNIFAALGLPPETIEFLMGIYLEGSEKPSFKPTPRMLLRLPRILRVILSKMRYSQRFNVLFPAMRETYQAFRTGDVDTLSTAGLINEIDYLFSLSRQTAYYNIIVQLLMGLYNALLKWQLKKVGVDFARFDLTGNIDELKQFDPTIRILVMNQQYRQLPEDIKDRVRSSSYEEFLRLPGIQNLQEEFTRFIQRFGHLSDSGNDFSAVPWHENPEVILKMIISCQQAENQPVRNICFEELHLSPIRRLLLSRIYHRARRFRLYREEVSFLYAYGFGLLRTCFLALADIFVHRGFIDDRNDIFYLSFEEVKDSVRKGYLERICADSIALRKREMNECQNITLPNVIYGEHPPPVMNHIGNKLKGTPTSRGYYRGPVKVIRGSRDFHKLEAGNVLVIPYSDVGWTPLFTRAGALIAESGGILSHSSIIAREYNIPAVVSVSGACQLKDDTLVSVDGYLGEILVHE